MTAFSHWTSVGNPAQNILSSRYSCKALATWALIVLSLRGCAVHSYQPADRLTDQGLRQFYLSSLRDLYPDSCRLTQQILIRYGNKDLDVLAYLYLNSDGTRLMMGLGDMGVEIFRFHFDANAFEVPVASGVISEKSLGNSLIRDLQHLFARKPEELSWLVRRSESVVGVVLQYEDGRKEEYQFVEGDQVPFRSLEVAKGHIIRDVGYHEIDGFPALAHVMPSRIILRNHVSHYVMEIRIVEVHRM